MVRTRSDIYNHSTTLADGRRRCKYCPEPDEHFYERGTATSALWVHLETHHGFKKEGESDQTPLAQAQQEALNNAFVRWIVTDLQPFTTSDNPEFAAFVKLLNDKYSLPCQQTVRNIVMEKFWPT
jgi:hypothetical protein